MTKFLMENFLERRFGNTGLQYKYYYMLSKTYAVTDSSFKELGGIIKKY